MCDSLQKHSRVLIERHANNAIGPPTHILCIYVYIQNCVLCSNEKHEIFLKEAFQI